MCICVQGYSDKGVGSVCMAIRGWTRDVAVTMSSTVWPSVYGPGISQYITMSTRDRVYMVSVV